MIDLWILGGCFAWLFVIIIVHITRLEHRIEALERRART